MSRGLIATAVVTLTVEVRANGSWGSDCKIDQVEKQAAESAIGYLLRQCARDQRVKIVGAPMVTTVMTRSE